MKRVLLVTTLGVTLIGSSVAHAADKGTVRFLHASPNAPAVDIYVNGKKAVAGLARGKITSYLDLGAGTYNYAIRAAGARRLPNNIVLSGRVAVASNRVATIAVTNAASNRHRLRVVTLRDAAVRPFGAARLRVAHLSPDAPPVDIVLQGAGKVVSKLRFTATSPYLTIPAGTYTFNVRLAGTTKNVLTLRNVRIGAGQLYTAWALGAVAPRRGELGLRGLVTTDKLPGRYARTQLRVLHASPGAPNVDVYVDGQRAIPDLPFGSAAPDDGSYLKLPSGAAAVAIRPAGADPASPPVYSANLDLAPQATVTAAARGQLADNTFTVSALIDDVSPTTGKARVTVAHLSPNTPAVDVYADASNTSGAPAISGLAFPTGSTSLLVPPATYTFGVTVAGSKALALTAGPAPLPANSTTVVYAIGLLGGTPALTTKALTTQLR